VVRQLAREVLEANGYRVLEAHHGVQALQVSEHHAGKVHLLVTDVVMPEMGGPALAERLAQQRPGLRTLFISGYADADPGRGFTLPPHAAFLPKPFPPSELLRKVRKTLDAPLPA
jgi:CheY-like chemotaxis protein